MKNLEQIKEIIRIHRKELEDKYKVKKIAVFGSFVRGEQSRQSDIDLLVEFDMKAFGENFEGLYDAFFDLSVELEKLLGRKVDILTPDSVKTIRIKEVAKNIRSSLVYV